MIPDPDYTLPPTDQRRYDLTLLAAALAEAGVPADVLVADVRDGIALAVTRRARSGR